MPLAPQNILQLIPQASPFIMVGQLIYNDDTTTRSSFTVTADNCMVDKGFFSEGGLMENIAQTAAARVGYLASLEDRPVAGGYIGAVKDLEVYFLPPAGSELVTEIKIENQVFNVSVILGQVWCNNELCACCEMKVFLNADE